MMDFFPFGKRSERALEVWATWKGSTETGDQGGSQ